MEAAAVNASLEPTLLIGVIGDSFVSFSPCSRNLFPLVHLAGSHESVGVVDCRSEALIYNLFSIFCGSHAVNELEVVVSINFLGIRGGALCTCGGNDLRVRYKLLFVLPEEDQRERDHHAADHETSNAVCVFI